MPHHFGPVGFLAIVVYLVVVCFPVGRILSRAGFSGFWALVALLPILNIIALWIFAFAEWPNLRRPA